MCKQQPELEAYAEKFADAEKSGAQLPPNLMQRLAEVKERADAAAKVSGSGERAWGFVDTFLCDLIPLPNYILCHVSHSGGCCC